MKILLFSDLHAHAFKNYSTVLPSGRNSRLQDAINVLQEIENLATQEKVDGILFGGDLFHVRPGTGTMRIGTFNAVFDAIARLKIGRSFVGLLVGNHDQGDRAGLEHSIYAFGSIVSVMDQAAWYTFCADSGEQLQVFAIPAQGDCQQIKDIVESNWNDDNEGAILLGHLPVAGAVVGCNFRMPSESSPGVEVLRPDLFHRIFLGDFHMPQTLQPGVQYIGATHHHNWGDAGQRRGCLTWDTVTDEVKFHHLESAPRFEKINFDDWENQVGLVAKGNYIRITHSSPIGGAAKDKITEAWMNAGAKAVEFWLDQQKLQSLSATEPTDYHPSMDYEEMVATFVRKEIGDGLDDDILVPLGKDIMGKALSRIE